jgi:arylsulfatase A-like enzyme
MRILPTLFATLALLATACRGGDLPTAAPSAGPASPPERPLPLAPVDLSCPGCNLIVLNVGNLRADHVGLLAPAGDAPHPGLTPAIDRFFGDSLIIEQASTPSGATYYSATAIATGTEAMFNGHTMRDDDALAMASLDPRRAEKWLAGGGRWLVLAALEREGELLVDRLPTIAQTLAGAGYHTVAVNDWIHTGRQVRLDRGFADYIELTDTTRTGPEDLTSTIPIDLQVELVLERLAAHRGAATAEPLYLYFHTNTLHFPFPHPREPGQLVFKRHGAALFAEAYRIRLQEMDRAFERIFSELAREGWLEDSVVLLYANHGLSLGEQGELGMGKASQRCVHAPLLLHHPGLAAARRIDRPVSLVDLAPTIFEILSVERAHETTAHSMLPLLAGTGPYGRSAIFGRDIQEEYVRVEAWKLIAEASARARLYDLGSDPNEERDLLNDEPERTAALRMKLERERLRQLELADALGLRFPPTEGAATP